VLITSRFKFIFLHVGVAKKSIKWGRGTETL
jgi:hypothetical protein